MVLRAVQELNTILLASASGVADSMMMHFSEVQSAKAFTSMAVTL